MTGNSFLIFWQIICRTILLMAFMVFTAFAETITLANGEWPPYFSKDLPGEGTISQLIRKAFEYENIKVDYVYFPWKRSYEKAKQGYFAGSAGWAKSPERAKYFYYSELPVVKESTVLYYHRENPVHWESLADLSELRIGGTLEYYYSKEFQQAKASGLIRVYENNSDIINLTLLINRRIDVFPINLEVARQMLNKNFSPAEIGQLRYHPNPLAEKHLFLIISKKYENAEWIMDKFNSGMGKLMALEKSGRN